MSSGMIISRLGIQASAVDDLVHGLICHRVSLPRENETTHALRWNLFPNNPPKIISEPTIHPLPLPLSIPRRSILTPRTSTARALGIASTLLSLQSPTSYPPNRGQTPRLEVAQGGQVCVVLDVVKGRKRPNLPQSQASSPSGAGAGKADWVIVLEFEAVVQEGSDRAYQKVLLSLPKCLHSVIRFQITPPTTSQAQPLEVSIMTEPKMLALAPSTFSSGPIPFPRTRGVDAVGYEEGWEDGENMRGGYDSESEGEGEGQDEDDGTWLEGRFQATNQLRLEWSFLSTSHCTTLDIEPRWHPTLPEIGFNYDSRISLPSSDRLNPLEIYVPEGWAWRDLHIAGDGLVSYRSTDTIADHWHWSRSSNFPSPNNQEYEDEDEDDEDGPEDSFSTIRTLSTSRRRQNKQRKSLLDTFLPPARPSLAHTRRPSSGGAANLMNAPLPDMKVDEFSFEMNSTLDPYSPSRPGGQGSRPGTPLLSHSRSPITPQSSTPGPRAGSSPATDTGLGTDGDRNRVPKPGRLFDLIFDDPDDDEGGEDERQISVKGTLVPLSPLLLISPSTPVDIPFVRNSSECLVRILGQGKEEGVMCDTTSSISGIGTFNWVDENGVPLLISKTPKIEGTVRVRVYRDKWGMDSTSIIFPWPRTGEGEVEVVFNLKAEPGACRISKATVGGIEIRRYVGKSPCGGSVVRRGGRGVGGMAELVLDFSSAYGGASISSSTLASVPIPVFGAGAGTGAETEVEGQLILELKGPGWEYLSRIASHASMKPSSTPGTWTIPVPLPPGTWDHLHTALSPSTHHSLILCSSKETRSAVRRARTLFSFSTFFNILLLWLVISLGQQVQRLRSEMAFVAEETRDLRMYSGSGGATVPPQPPIVGTDPKSSRILPDGLGLDFDVKELLDRLRREDERLNSGSGSGGQSVDQYHTQNHSLGRVVFGHSGWEWANHPALRTVSRGVARIWDVVIWLLHG